MNKIIVSIVFALILILGINRFADFIFYVDKPEKSAYQVANVQTVSDIKDSTTTSSGSGDIINLFASVSSADGKKIFKKCTACHTIAKNGANKIGPALWGVLGRQVGSLSDYKYSKALASYQKKWSIKEINGFLTKPKDWIKGTKMSYAGLKNAKERAALILYMNENTDSPIPLQ